MAINFNSLPNTRPNQLPEPGKYYATIEKAEMTKPKDPTRPRTLILLWPFRIRMVNPAEKYSEIYFLNQTVILYAIKSSVLSQL